jgi:hypothetical protein
MFCNKCFVDKDKENTQTIKDYDGAIARISCVHCGNDLFVNYREDIVIKPTISHNVLSYAKRSFV